MLIKAEIENFKCHKNTVFEFIPGTNVIIGKSDKGKSAAFGAINWVFSNRPLGDSFRSDWGGDTRVALYFSEGTVIERIRSVTKNEYIINKGEPLTAFSTGVPEDIVNMLQIDPANIQGQMDPHFLLAATPGEAARMLNKAASIDDIDHTISGLKKSYSRIDNDIKYNKKQIGIHAEEIKQYDNIPVIETKLIAVEELDAEFLQKRKECSELILLVVKASDIKEELAKTKHIPSLLQKHADAEKQFHTYQEKLSQHRKYSAAADKAVELDDELGATEYVDQALPLLRETDAQFTNWSAKNKRISELRRLSRNAEKTQRSLKSTEFVEQAHPLILKAETAFLHWTERNRRLKELRRLVDTGQKRAASISSVQKAIARLEKEFKELAPGVCPLCGGRMDSGNSPHCK